MAGKDSDWGAEVLSPPSGMKKVLVNNPSGKRMMDTEEKWHTQFTRATVVLGGSSETPHCCILARDSSTDSGICMLEIPRSSPPGVQITGTSFFQSHPERDFVIFFLSQVTHFPIQVLWVDNPVVK